MMERLRWAFENQDRRINCGSVKFARVKNARKARRCFSGNWLQRVLKAYRAYPAIRG